MGGVSGAHAPTGSEDSGHSLGHDDFVQAELELVAVDHQVLLDRIPGVPDVQAAWLLLLHCAQGEGQPHLEDDPSRGGEEVR